MWDIDATLESSHRVASKLAFSPTNILNTAEPASMIGSQ
jgi:hypothetical protein